MSLHCSRESSISSTGELIRSSTSRHCDCDSVHPGASSSLLEMLAQITEDHEDKDHDYELVPIVHEKPV